MCRSYQKPLAKFERQKPQGSLCELQEIDTDLLLNLIIKDLPKSRSNYLLKSNSTEIMLLEILLRDMFCNKTYPGPGVSKLCDLRLNIFALRFAHLVNSVGRLRRDNVHSKVFCDVSISKES